LRKKFAHKAFCSPGSEANKWEERERRMKAEKEAERERNKPQFGVSPRAPPVIVPPAAFSTALRADGARMLGSSRIVCVHVLCARLQLHLLRKKARAPLSPVQTAGTAQ